MKRLLSTRYGFFGFAALVCFATVLVIEAEHRFVSLGLGALYAVLSVLFLLDEIGRGSRGVPPAAVDHGDDPALFAPPPRPGTTDE